MASAALGQAAGRWALREGPPARCATVTAGGDVGAIARVSIVAVVRAPACATAAAISGANMAAAHRQHRQVTVLGSSAGAG